MLCRAGASLSTRLGSRSAAAAILRLAASRQLSAQRACFVQQPSCRHGICTAAAARDAAAPVMQVPENKQLSQLPHIIETNNVPVYLYAPLDEVEPDAIQQLVRVAETPGLATGYVSAMPDVHLGCGMCAVPIDGQHKDDMSLDDNLKIQGLIKKRIPVGFAFHARYPLSVRALLEEISHQHAPSKFLEALAAMDKAAAQLGTLGGGNHFLEVVHDETGRVWIVLHSGSRGIGNECAQHHDTIAADYLKQSGIETATVGLNFMRIDSDEGQAYLQDMEWCQKYAFENRAAMLRSMVDCVEEVTGKAPDLNKSINIHHNYCSCERCQFKDPRTNELVDKNLWVTRKGATSAKPGQLGIIPGSMGVGSFITRGKGNAQSWSSCSHGAGRKMSRTKASSNILQEDFEAAMAGIVCDTVEAVRDEAPQAYKDLTQVMANQADLTEIVHRLQPLINVKGYGNGMKRLEHKARQRRKAATKAAEAAAAAVGAGEEESAASAVAEAGVSA